MMKIPREHVEAVVSVILRVPSLFIIEVWYRMDPEKSAKAPTRDVEVILSVVYYLGNFSDSQIFCDEVINLN